MGVTISADGLSIVHQGSGGEASATLPDVCNTTMGNAVVAIAYGNSAKSADLADGTTTVTADGGNSIAIKDSMFSASTGDAGGDKKGVSSGTIEAEAKFISASPTVILEGKGVCRLSDQMTMNAGNTMCMGGVQNPSVSVEPDDEGTYTIDIHCRYPDGTPLEGAPFTVKDHQGGVLAEGQLNSAGKAAVGGLPNARYIIEYGEHSGPFTLKSPRDANPHCQSLDDTIFFDMASKTEQPFWVPSGKITQRHWGYIGETLADSTDIRQMLATEVRAYFQRTLTEQEACDIVDSLMALFGAQPVPDEVLLSLVSKTSPLIDDNGDVFALFVNIHKDESGDNLLAAMRSLGSGSPAQFLAELDWDAQTTAISKACTDILDSTTQRLSSVQFYASTHLHTYVADNIKAHSSTIKDAAQALPEQLSASVTLLQSKVATIQAHASPVMVVKEMGTTRTTTASNASDVVHTMNNLPRPLEICLAYDDIERTPVPGVAFSVMFANGEERKGVLDAAGRASLVGVPQVGANIEFGDADEAAAAKDSIKADYDDLKAAVNELAVELAVTTRQKVVPVPVPPEEYLRVKALVEDELAELKRQGDAFDDLSYLEKGWGYAKSAAAGAGTGVMNYIPDFGGMGDLLEEADIGINVLIEALATGDIDILQRKLDAVDRAALGLQEASEAMEMLILLISDPTSREYLASLPRRFLEASPPDDITQIMISQAVQKGIDVGMVTGGTALATTGAAAVGMLGGPAVSATATAAGAAGPATATALSAVVVARNGGKAMENLFSVLEKIAKKKKAMLNKHDTKQHQKDNETKLARQNGGDCPLCSKQVPKKGKKPKKTTKNLCKHEGYKGDLYEKGQAKFGFTRRGLTGSSADKEQRKHSPWTFMKMTPLEHPWWVRVYDKDDKGRYRRPLHPAGSGGGIHIVVAAHHLVTINEMAENTFLHKLLPQVGYDINQTHNITVLPTIPELACALGVPLHNSSHPDPYTEEISKLLKKLKEDIEASDFCNDSQTARDKIETRMQSISTTMLGLMNEFAHEGLISLPVEFAGDYQTGKAGCRGQTKETGKRETAISQCTHRESGTSHAFCDYRGAEKTFSSVNTAQLGK